MNAVSIDDDGNLLLSARHTSAVYKIDRRTGTVVWRLGGKRDWYDAERGNTIASVTWNGLDTIIPVDKYLTSVRVVARDRTGHEIGRILLW